MALSVSRETREKFSRYVELLLKWGSRTNLMSHSDLTEDSIWGRHREDSLQLVPFISDTSLSICDVGSGAGFPGLVLAISGFNQITLVEKDKKKISFLRTVSRELGLHVDFYPEDVSGLKHRFDVVVSRAFAHLNVLCNISERLLTSNGYALYLKGAMAIHEIEEAQVEWSFSYLSFQSKTATDGVILKLWDIKRRGEGDLNCNCKSEGRRW